LRRAYTAKPPGVETDGFAFSPYDVGLERTLSGGVEPECKLNAPSPTTPAYARAPLLSRGRREAAGIA
jgi:hypothetical protein